MPRWIRTHPAVTALLTILALAAFVAVLWALETFLNLNSSTVAAGATALAAVFAAISAASSSQTARESARALSWATKPTLEIYPSLNKHAGQRSQVFEIRNTGHAPVDRMKVSWRLSDGTTGSAQDLGPLPASADYTISGAQHPSHRVDVGIPPLTSAGVDQLTVDYRGIQGAIGWREIHEWTYEQTDIGGEIVRSKPIHRLISETEIE